MEPKDSLESLEPSTAVEMYLNDRRREVSEDTLQSHRYRLDRFLEWCNEQDMDDMTTLGGRDLHRFKLWRERDNIADWTLKSQMDTLRVFVRFCESIDGCVDGLAESINSPSVTREDARGKDILPVNRADEILAYLSKYEYASERHTLARLLWSSGMRVGAARSIDLADCELDPSDGYIRLRNRPEQDTRLKNGDESERSVALDDQTCIVIADYIDENREEVEDEFGRKALFTTEHGRASINTLRCWMYRVTRPCEVGRECPHDRDPDDCEAVQSRMSASKCPDSVGTHAFRRGAITHYLAEGAPTRVVSDRMDVGQDTLSQHYDARSEYEKMEQRREYVDRVNF